MQFHTMTAFHLPTYVAYRKNYMAQIHHASKALLLIFAHTS